MKTLPEIPPVIEQEDATEFFNSFMNLYVKNALSKKIIILEFFLINIYRLLCIEIIKTERRFDFDYTC